VIPFEPLIVGDTDIRRPSRVYDEQSPEGMTTLEGYCDTKRSGMERLHAVVPSCLEHNGDRLTPGLGISVIQVVPIILRCAWKPGY
jgi:hypothetical protein